MAIKRGIICLVFVSILLIIPSISADSAGIVINNQPNSIYNFGDTVNMGVVALKPSTAFSGTIEMHLICNGIEFPSFYTNQRTIPANTEYDVVDAQLILSQRSIGTTTGTCRIKATMGTDYALTNDFTISNSLTINTNFTQTTFNPGDTILVKGTAVKDDGNVANGYIDLIILSGNSTVFDQPGTMNNGQFSVNITFPAGMPSGTYLVKLNAYERDSSNSITNAGTLGNSIFIKQVPASLDIVFESANVTPGTDVRVKAILYDQSGVKIDSQVFLTLKDSRGKIVEQVEVPTDQTKNFSIAYDEAPAAWKIVALSSKLTSDSSFNILENENATIELVNDTILATNTGNVAYNKTVLVKVGNHSLNLQVYLDVDQSQRWLITAPNGKYNVQVINGGVITGASILDLTGSTVDIRKASAGIGSLVGIPFVWIFIFLILGATAFIIFRSGYPKAFIGHSSESYGSVRTPVKIGGTDVQIYNPKSSRAELALSIKGDNQPVSMVTLKIKNLSIKQAKNSGADGVLSKIISAAEDQKAAIYESNDNLCFILSALRTRTFKNEDAALKLSQKIKAMLDEHNRMFKQRISFGISLTHGEIIARQEPEAFKFMAMGNLMTQAKKIASMADNEVLMGGKMTDKLRTSVKSEKLKKDNMEVHSIKEIKDSEKNEKFIKGFMKRMEKDKK